MADDQRSVYLRAKEQKGKKKKKKKKSRVTTGRASKETGDVSVFSARRQSCTSFEASALLCSSLIPHIPVFGRAF